MGHIALTQIKTTGEGGRGLAIAALVIGYASMAIGAYIITGLFSAEGATTADTPQPPRPDSAG